MGSSTHSSGLESVASSMTFSGLTAGLKSVLERSEAVLTCLLSTSSLTLLSVPTMAVYRWVAPSPTSGEGGLWEQYHAWLDRATALPYVARTLPDKDRYLLHVSRTRTRMRTHAHTRTRVTL